LEQVIVFNFLVITFMQAVMLLTYISHLLVTAGRAARLTLSWRLNRMLTLHWARTSSTWASDT